MKRRKFIVSEIITTLTHLVIELPSYDRSRWSAVVEYDGLKEDCSEDSRANEAFVGFGNLFEISRSTNAKDVASLVATCKHCERVNVMEISVVFPLEASPKVRD